MAARSSTRLKSHVRNNRTGAQIWIKGALDTIAHEGVHALRIDRLARDIKVSRGSFYWFFGDIDELYDCCIAYWRETLNGEVFEKVRSLKGSTRVRLYGLVDTIFIGKLGRYDAAIRAWALTNPKVRAAVRDLDRERLDFLYLVFSGDGEPEEHTLQRVHLFYRAVIAESYLNEYPRKGTNVTYLKGLVDMLTTPPPIDRVSKQRLSYKR